MAKQKRTKKELESQINELGQGLGSMYVETQKLGQFMIGLENLVMYLAEHLDKKESFEEFIKEKLKEGEERDLPKEESK